MSGVGILQSVHVLGLQTFGALLDLELNLRAFIQCAVPVGLDGREMHKHVVTAGPLDESIALAALNHFTTPFSFTYELSSTLFRHAHKRPYNKKATNGKIRSLHSHCLYEQPFDLAPQFSQIVRSTVKPEIALFVSVGHFHRLVLTCGS